MELKKFIIELRYKDIASPFNFRASLFANLTGDVPKKEINIQEGLQVFIKDREAKFIVEPRRWGLSVNTISSIEDTKNFAQKIFKKVNSAVHWDKGVRIGVRTIWIEESSKKFSELVDLFKKHLLKDNKFVTDAIDVALPLTMQNGDDKINYLFGPMEKEQLIGTYFNDLSTTEEKNWADVNCVLDFDYFHVGEKKFNEKFFKEFLNNSIDFSSKNAEKTFLLLND